MQEACSLQVSEARLWELCGPGDAGGWTWQQSSRSMQQARGECPVLLRRAVLPVLRSKATRAGTLCCGRICHNTPAILATRLTLGVFYIGHDVKETQSGG